LEPRTKLRHESARNEKKGDWMVGGLRNTVDAWGS